MTRDEALSILELPDGVGAGEIRDRVREQYSEFQLRLDNSPTTNLKLTYQKKIGELQEAGEVLLGDDTWLDEGRDLPVSEPSHGVRPTVGSSSTPVAGQSSTTVRKERDCPYCAERIMPNATRCRWCGQAVSPIAADEAGKRGAPANLPDGTKQKSRRTLTITLAAVVAVLLAGVVLVKLGPRLSAASRASNELDAPRGPMAFAETYSGTTHYLYDVWGSSSSDVWAVGDSGTIVHYDGNSWTPTPPRDTTEWFSGIWGSSASDVWAVGGAVRHYDGSEWASVSIPKSQSLWAVWGSSASDVWAVGQAGSISHYAGTDWSRVTSPTPLTLSAIWGTSRSDIWAVGPSGTILHYDGSVWSNVSSGTGEDLHGVWAADASDAWAVGDKGTILHYDGASWSRVESGATKNLFGVSGNSRTDVWVVGGTPGTNQDLSPGSECLHYNGTQWSMVPIFINQRLTGVWGSSSGGVWVVGSGGTIFHGVPGA